MVTNFNIVFPLHAAVSNGRYSATGLLKLSWFLLLTDIVAEVSNIFDSNLLLEHWHD